VSEARFRLKSQARPAHLCPDWLAGLELPADRIVLAEAPPAVLIGRIGVNSASPKTDEDNAFAIGRDRVIPVPARSIGPLHVSFNVAARLIWLQTLIVKVSVATPTI